MRTVVMGQECAVHTHREVVPIERHHVWPLGLGGPNVDANKITVCANGHYTIHAYLDLLMKHGSEAAIPAEVRRLYGRRARVYARRGWTEAGSPTG